MVPETRFLSFMILQSRGLALASKQESGATFINKFVSFGYCTLVETAEFEKF
jgi:hypothetical protein